MTREHFVVPRVDEREWVRQQEELAFLFARPLGMSRWRYVDTTPDYTRQPEGYKGEYNDLVLVQPPTPKLPFRRILEITGLSFDTDVLKMRDWSDDKGNFRTPSIVYATWVDDGGRNIGIAPSVVRNNLAEGARVGTGLDGVFLYVADRGVLRRHYLDLPGSEVGSDSAPSLHLWPGGPRFHCDWVDRAFSHCGSVVAGRKIVTRDLAA